MSKADSRTIIVNEIYPPDKPDFMTKERLAEELGFSIGYIDSLMKYPKPVLEEEVHYTRSGKNGRTLRFYYPQIKKDLAPKLADVV